MLKQTVAELRDRTQLATEGDASARSLDVALFAASVLAGLLTGTMMMTLGALAAPLVLGITLARSGSRVSTAA